MGVVNASNKKMAPCQEACPAGIDVPRYVRTIREGRFEEALAVIREKIPFPFVCGYACVHPCEAKCSRNQFEGPVAIRMLKRITAEKGCEKTAPDCPHEPHGQKGGRSPAPTDSTPAVTGPPWRSGRTVHRLPEVPLHLPGFRHHNPGSPGSHSRSNSQAPRADRCIPAARRPGQRLTDV